MNRHAGNRCRFIANRSALIAVQGVCRTPGETLPRPAQESLWVSLRCASVSIGLEKGLPSFGIWFPRPYGTPPGGRPPPRLGMDPWIIGAEGPPVALGILAGVVAPAVV